MPDRRLRLLITTQQYYPDVPTGSGRLAFDEALYLVGLGHEVWVVVQDLIGNHVEYNQQDGLHVLRYPCLKVGLFDPRRRKAHQQQTQMLLGRYLGSGGVDIVHGHSLLQYDGALEFCGPTVRKCYSVHSPVVLEMQANGRGGSAIKRLRLALVGALTHRVERRCLEQGA